MALPAPSPPPPFVHRANYRWRTLVESYCPLCGLLVGVSRHPEFLAAAEKAHTCPKQLVSRESKTKVISIASRK